MTGVLKAQRLFRPGKGPNGGDENGDDDFAWEERRAFALSVALNREPCNCEQKPVERISIERIWIQPVKRIVIERQFRPSGLARP